MRKKTVSINFRTTTENGRKLQERVELEDNSKLNSIHLMAEHLIDRVLNRHDDAMLEALNFLALQISKQAELIEKLQEEVKELRQTVSGDLHDIAEILNE